MYYFIFDLLLIVAGGAGGYFIARRGNNKDSLTRRERAELDAKRSLVDTLTGVAMDNIESDPLAQIVLDEIRKSGRKELP